VASHRWASKVYAPPVATNTSVVRVATFSSLGCISWYSSYGPIVGWEVEQGYLLSRMLVLNFVVIDDDIQRPERARRQLCEVQSANSPVRFDASRSSRALVRQHGDRDVDMIPRYSAGCVLRLARLHRSCRCDLVLSVV
jgi:hypothetical protein